MDINNLFNAAFLMMKDENILILRKYHFENELKFYPYSLSMNKLMNMNRNFGSSLKSRMPHLNLSMTNGRIKEQSVKRGHTMNKHFINGKKYKGYNGVEFIDYVKVLNEETIGKFYIRKQKRNIS